MESDLNAVALLSLVGIGIFAGTINTIAGGGSLIALPALIFFGLSANVANATNRIGVFVQSGLATNEFRRAGVLELDTTLKLVPPTIIGAILGSLISVDIDEKLFRAVIGVMMLVMLGAVIIKPKRWLQGKGGDAPLAIGWKQIVGFFFVGFYGGFLQAGVGIFILVALVLLAGRDLVKANASKVMLIATFTLPALLIYIYNDLIHWPAGLALAVGSGIGGWVGTRLTVSWGPQFARWVLIVVVSLSSIKLLGLLPW